MFATGWTKPKIGFLMSAWSPAGPIGSPQPTSWRTVKSFGGSQPEGDRRDVDLVKESERFKGVHCPKTSNGRLKLLKLSLTLPAPRTRRKPQELTRIKSAMEGMYGKGKYCPATPPKQG